MSNVPRCSKCGRPLKSPLSIARGMGSTCAGGNSHKGSSKIARTRAFGEKEVLDLGKTKFEFVNGYWTSGKDRVSDDRMKEWLLKNHIIEKEESRNEK